MSDENKVLNIIFILLCVGLVFLFNKKLDEKKTLEKESNLLVNEQISIENKIKGLMLKEQKENSSYANTLNELNLLLSKLEMLSVKDESEFKKMVYILAKESNLKLKEISKSETLWERNGYRLKYIHFNLYGSLNDFGKFMFFVNKSKK